MLQIFRLNKSFAGFRAVRNVSLLLDTGERHAIIGPNGAGKTTFFHLITGYLQADSGDIFLGSKAITGLPPHQIVNLGIARSFQQANIYPGLTVADNVQVALIARSSKAFAVFHQVKGLYRRETEELLALVGLEHRADESAAFLAYGEQKQLELAIVLAMSPNMLLLDEPTAGMSATDTETMMFLIENIAAERGLTLLFTEHDMGVVFSMADRISVMHLGEIIATGPPSEIRKNREVERVYLRSETNA